MMQILDGKIELNELNQNAMGGSELMANRIASDVEQEYLDGCQIIVSRLRNDLDKDKHRIYYCHDLPQDPESNHLKDGGWKKFHKIVFVSHWQQQHYINMYGIPWSHTVVLKNAIKPIELDLSAKFSKKKDTIDLVYHTTPHRGLEILVPVFKELKKTYSALNLHVYSSFNIYGWADRDEQYRPIFDEIEAADGMHLYDILSNDLMCDRLKDMDVFAYPSIWPETSCISLIEAMSAGCLCVHPNLAALYETASNWTTMYNWHENKEKHASQLYHILRSSIDIFERKDDSLLHRLQGQKSYTDLYYNWSIRTHEWEQFLAAVKTLPLSEPVAENTSKLKRKGFSYKTGPSQ